MIAQTYINDGYTLSGQVSSLGGAFGHDGLSFMYRPIIGADRQKYTLLKRTRQDHNAQALLDHLVSWSLEEPITPRSIHGLHYNVRQQLHEAILLAPSVEREQTKNLTTGAYLARRYPAFAFRSCSDCRKWKYSEDGRVVVTARDGERAQRGDLPVLCETSWCPKGKWDENPFEWLPENKMAYRFHQECKSVSSWPDDSIVRRNARAIEFAFEKAVKDGQ